MQYKTLKNVQLDGEIRRVGDVVEIVDEAMAQKLLSKGTIELVQTVEVSEPPQAPVVAEVAQIATAPLEVQTDTVTPELPPMPNAQELEQVFVDTGAVSAPESELSVSEPVRPAPINIQFQ